MLYQSSDQILGEIQLRWRYFSHLSKRFLELIISTTHERVVSQLRALFSVVSIYTYSDFIKRTERITSHSHRRSIDVGRLAVDIRRSHSVVLIFFLYIFSLSELSELNLWLSIESPIHKTTAQLKKKKNLKSTLGEYMTATCREVRIRLTHVAFSWKHDRNSRVVRGTPRSLTLFSLSLLYSRLVAKASQ